MRKNLPRRHRMGRDAATARQVISPRGHPPPQRVGRQRHLIPSTEPSHGAKTQGVRSSESASILEASRYSAEIPDWGLVLAILGRTTTVVTRVETVRAKVVRFTGIRIAAGDFRSTLDRRL